MALTLDSGRQYPIVARLAFTYAELGTAVTAGTVVQAFKLPANAIVIGGHVLINTAFVGPTAATIDIGDGLLATRYNTAVNLKATAGTRTALGLTGYKYLTGDTVDFNVIQSVAVSSAGAAEVVLEYVIAGSADETQG